MNPSPGEFFVDGLRLAYREQGCGPLLLILPGNTASSACHSGELDYFGACFRCVAPDFRGIGRSERLPIWPDEWYQHCAHDMAALLAHLGEQQCIVMGTSGGAIVALWMAILYPQSVCAVIADSTLAAYPPAWLHRVMGMRAERSPGQIHFWQGAHGDDWAQVVEADTAMLRWIAEHGGHIFDDRLGEICCPVLVTASLGDTMLPDIRTSQLDLIAAIRDSRLFLAKVGDHPLMWSNPEEFRRAVNAFLAGVAAG
ncbi:MAG: alpha/beta hydrolase [Caldilinea sp.]